MKILVVEDDRLVAQTLQLLFESYRYAADIATDGEEGLEMADMFAYDLIVLDLLLPRLDGISVCQKLRSKGLQTPILLLTGQGETRQKAIALNAGADDYLVKPFDVEELMARVQALLRRGDVKTPPILQWGILSVDPNLCQVTYGSSLLSATPKEYAILELFLRHPQQIFSAAVILDRVWESVETPGEEVIRFHIKELRKKLQAVGAPGDLIQTVYRVGYRLNPLYAEGSADFQDDKSSKALQLDALKLENKALRDRAIALKLTRAELMEKNRELMVKYETLKRERQQLQAENEELKRQLATLQSLKKIDAREI